MAKKKKSFTMDSGYSKRQWRQYREILMMVAMAFIFIGCYFIWSMSPVWQQAGQAAVPAFVQFVSVIFTVIQIGFWLAVIVAALWGAAKVYAIYSESRLQWARPNDAGFFPLQTIDANGGGVAGFFGGLLGGSYKMIADINKSPTGVLHSMIETPRMDSNQQLAYATTIAKAQTFSTIAKNNMRAATARAALSNMDRHHNPKAAAWTVVDEPVVPVALPEVKLIDAQQAFDQSTDTKWIVGQNRTTGNLCEINVRELLYWGVLGEKRTGKTSRVGKLLFAYALRFGFKTIVVDGKGGADWEGVCKGRAEFHKFDHTNIGDIIYTLTEERKRRQAILNQHGVNNIWLLPKEAKIQPVLTIFDEFGSVMDSLKSMDKAAYDKVDVAFGDFFRLGGSTGLCATIIDQFPGKWGKATRANLSSNIAFKVGGGLGAAIGEYNLHNLKKDGGFYFEQEMYHGFDTWNHIEKLLPQPNRNIKNMFRLDCDDNRTSSNGSESVGEYLPVYTPPIKVEPAKPVPVVLGGSEQFPDNGNGNSNKVQPLLNGRATNRGERLLIRATYEREGSKNKAVKALWGSKNGKTLAWLDEALAA
jgi:hypothetical protein